MADGTSEPAEQFDSYERQVEAARLGMWVFLASEILLFAGLFTLYAAYRTLYPEDFIAAAAHNNRTIGTVNTLVLITSSLTVALAVHYGQVRSIRRVRWFLVATLALGCVFLALKGVEYWDHARHGLLPGRHFTSETLDAYGSRLLVALYFSMTGLHALHVVAGLSVLCWLLAATFGAGRLVAVGVRLELGALYWHLVDLIWIFLWPLLYLTH